MELAGIHSPTTAFVAGLVTSLHCAGMCGPIACWLTPVRPEEDATTFYSVYHLTRLGGYALLGAVAGGLGGIPLGWFNAGAARLLPWALVAFFVLVALRWDKRLPRIAALSRWAFKLQAWGRGRSRLAMAAVIGIATPLLPCGPLYFLIALASLSGSAIRGVEFMLAFGLGTLPLLWFAQANFTWVRARMTPLWLGRSRIALALVAALVTSWRLRGTLGLGGPGIDQWLCF